MGEHVNGKATNILGALGVLLLLAMAARTALISIPDGIERYRSSRQQATTATEDETSNATGRQSSE